MIADGHRRWLLRGLAAVVVVVVVVRLATLLRIDLWFDELYSVYAASGDLTQLWSAALADRVNPPGFYLVLYGWLKLVPPTPLGLRILAFFTWVIMLCSVAWMARRFRLDATATGLVVLLVAINPVLFELGALLRGYALLVALTSVALGATATRLAPTDGAPRVALAYLILPLALATWIHYFAWPIVAAILLALLAARRWRDALWTGSLTVAASLPWWIALRQAPPTPRTLGAQLDFVTIPTIRNLLDAPGELLMTGASVVTLLAAFAVWEAAYRQRRSPTGLLLLAAISLPIVIAFGVTTYSPIPAWAYRYLAVAAPSMVVILVARWHAAPALLGGIAAALIAIGAYRIVDPIHQNLAWRQLIARIQTGSPADTTTVYASEGFTILPLRYNAWVADAAIRVVEVHGMPAPGAVPGWLLIRPGTLPTTVQPWAVLTNMGREVTDTFTMGAGDLAVRGWRFK